MKIRTGFVSNSSSSSFICDTCGETFEGMDLCPTDAEHYECCNGHIFCDKEVLGEVDEDLDEYGGSVRVELCPCCSFKIVAERDTRKYLEKVYNISSAEVFEEIKKLNKRRKRIYDGEYITYVCQRFNTNTDVIEEEIRVKFKTYDEFKMFKS